MTATGAGQPSREIAVNGAESGCEGGERKFHSLAQSAAGVAAAVVIATTAAPVGAWTGPGARACHGRCSAEWVMSQLPRERQEQVRAAMERRPLPMWVRDGDRLALMTYYAGGPSVERGGVAVLEHPEIASGWRLPDGALWMQIEGCMNWVLIDGHAPPRMAPEIDAEGFFSPSDTASGALPASIPALFVGGGGDHHTAWPAPSRAVSPTNPAPIPLPAAGWLLLAALAGLFSFKRWRRV